VKIIFDLQALQNESRSRGIGRYVRHLFTALSGRKDVELFCLLNGALEHLEEEREFVAGLINPERILVWRAPTPTKLIDDNHDRFRLAEKVYEDFLNSLQFDVLLVGSLFEGFSDNTVTSLKGSGPYQRFTILYDLIPLLFPDEYLGWDKIHHWYHDRLAHLQAASGLLAISQSARSEAIDCLRMPAGKVVAIGTGTDPNIFNSRVPLDSRAIRKLGITRRFVMHTSAMEPRKNFDGLIKAFASIPESTRAQHQLVLVGRGNESYHEELRRLIGAQGLGPDEVIMPGHVSDADLVQLYRQCALFVFPSRHEGFGLPVLEAMSCGCPAIGSNNSSIPEVIGRTDLLFDPDDTASIANSMLAILTSNTARQDAISHATKHSKKFRWPSIASRAIKTMGKRPSDYLPRYPSVEESVQYILADASSYQLHSLDKIALAKAVVWNETQAVEYISKTGRAELNSWRVEGPFDSSYSLALLNRETARALSEIGYHVSLFSTEGPGDFDPNPFYLQLHPDLAEMHDRSKSEIQSDCDVVSRILYPPRVKDMQGKINALHHYAWEETGFPQEWVEEFNSSLTMMTCLSRQVEKVMIDNGVVVPMITSGCGVDHWTRVKSEDFSVSAKKFRFLHVSSCFPRKGAELLLDAYGQSFTAGDDVSLIIKTFENPHNGVATYLEELRKSNSNYPHVELISADLTDSQLKRLYETCDVLVGPSYGEGFGLPFAEALLSGLPVITTNWGGQLDFCNSGNSWLVDYDFDWTRTHFGVWLSAWAKPRAEDLSSVMRTAFDTPKAVRNEMAARGRAQLLANNRWTDVAHRLSAAAKILPATARENSFPRVGWISTWGSRCGIAGYSQHLTSKLNLPVTIFAPLNEDHEKDGQQVLRSWSIGKEPCGLDTIPIDDVDVLVVQFNYNFYNHLELGKLIRQAKSKSKSVIITLHSTVDPPELHRHSEFFLDAIKADLSICDRLLVHSIHDLNRLKAIGLVENVALFPLGVLDVAPVEHRSHPRQVETVTTYGFALPNKGLEEVVQAIAILKSEGRPVRLVLNNAEYPNPASTAVIAALQELIKRFALEDLVELNDDYVSDAESISRIRKANLAVFAYRQTGESASAAVRFGLAAGVPVAVTPLPIFDDLRDAVFRFDGIEPSAIAEGIAKALDAVKNADEPALHIQRQADQWRKQHGYSAVGKRLANICIALTKSNHLRNGSMLAAA